MWLVLDVGNSAIKAGITVDRAIVDSTSLHDVQDDERCERLKAFIDSRRIDRIGCATVVPESRKTIARFASAIGVAHPFFVSADVVLPFGMDYDTPHTLGADRIATAAAAFMMYGRETGRTTVSVDLGTAVTYEVVSSQGVFEGGAIAPGPGLMARGLHLGTEQLPEAPLEVPRQVIGRSTTEALQSGIIFGLVDSIGGMLDRIAAASGELEVVVTGGWSEMVSPYIDRPHRVDPYLALHGVRLLMENNP